MRELGSRGQTANSGAIVCLVVKNSEEGDNPCTEDNLEYVQNPREGRFVS